MKIINVLTEGFKTSNGSAFLFPLRVHKKALKNEGVQVNLVHLYSPNITDCDVLFIDSKTFHKIWPKNPNYVSSKHQADQLWGSKLQAATKELLKEPGLRYDVERALANSN